MTIPPKTGDKFCELLDIIARLRAPGGCPWDQKQTVQTFKPFLLEETHELSEALDTDDIEQVREELGDLFFQLGFINQLYEEKNNFTMAEVLQTIIDKMIRRHPHVFEGKTFASDIEMRRNWAKIKEKENAGKTKQTYALDVPRSMPALTRSYRVSSRAARTGFDWPDIQYMTDKLTDEFNELMKAMKESEPSRISEELGDLFLMLVNIGRKLDVNCEECLHGATDKFINRFKKMEDLISRQNQSIPNLDTSEKIEFWQQAKDMENE
ncbi:MAG: nucleoside triphosphate pyrophosphohydrolase [Desulfobulbaceae bacterium]|nr:nucleoside triphosphate pyrophosphohydrolase [Desulfobulbaceae bacterium]